MILHSMIKSARGHRRRFISPLLWFSAVIFLLIMAFSSVFHGVRAGEQHQQQRHVFGHIEILEAYARPNAKNINRAAAFMTITNHGDADVLLALHTPLAERVEIHETIISQPGHVMHMRPLSDGLPLPARATQILAPGGKHLMLMGLAAPLEEGQQLALTLIFQKAGRYDVTLPIIARTHKRDGADLP